MTEIHQDLKEKTTKLFQQRLYITNIKTNRYNFIFSMMIGGLDGFFSSWHC